MERVAPHPTAEEVSVALVRHGAYEQPDDVPSAWLPQPLTAEGRVQAVAAASALAELARERGVALDPVIDASDLQRAWETAQLIATELGAPHRVEAFGALRERGLGAGANLTLAQLETIVARDPRHAPLPRGWKAQSGFRLPLPGAETLLEAGARVASHIERRAAQTAPGSMKICVGHGAAFRHAAHALGVLSRPEIAALSMFHGVPVVVARAKDGTWRHVAGRWKIRGAASGAASGSEPQEAPE